MRSHFLKLSSTSLTKSWSSYSIFLKFICSLKACAQILTIAKLLSLFNNIDFTVLLLIRWFQYCCLLTSDFFHLLFDSWLQFCILFPQSICLWSVENFHMKLDDRYNVLEHPEILRSMDVCTAFFVKCPYLNQLIVDVRRNVKEYEEISHCYKAFNVKINRKVFTVFPNTLR